MTVTKDTNLKERTQNVDKKDFFYRKLADKIKRISKNYGYQAEEVAGGFRLSNHPAFRGGEQK